MARVSMLGWWWVPAAAFLVTLAGDAMYVATRSLTWWRFSEWALLVAVASGFLGLVLLGRRSPRPPDVSAVIKLESAAWVLMIAALVDASMALGMRLIALPTGALAWLALYVTGASCLLWIVAGGVAWRARRIRGARLRVAMAPERERARR